MWIAEPSRWMVAAFVGAMIVGAGMATPLPAQFGDLVGDFLELDGNMLWNGVEIDAVNTGDATNRTWFRGDGTWSGVGLADAGHDVLDATMSTMNTSTWETLMSVTVDVPETTDRVLASVAGQFAWMGTTVFVIDYTQGIDQLCEIPDPAAPVTGVTCRDMAASVNNPTGMAIRAVGGVWVADSQIPTSQLCEIPNPTTPSSNVVCRNVPSSAGSLSGLTTRRAGGLWATGSVSGVGAVLCAFPNPAAPLTDVVCQLIGSDFTDSQHQARGLTTRVAGGLWLAASDHGEIGKICSIPDPAAPDVDIDSEAECGTLPAPGVAVMGVTTRAAGGVLIVRRNDDLCEVPDADNPGDNVACRELDSEITDPRAITTAGADGECMIRLARGNVAIETLMFGTGRILLDTTLYDRGASGSTTYAVQMMTANPYTLCTLNRGNELGTIPLPSMLVRVFFGT